MTFEDFLRDCMDNGHTQVRLVPRYSDEGNLVCFYAHGQCGIGASQTFESTVSGNVIAGPEQVAGPAPVAGWDDPAPAPADASEDDLSLDVVPPKVSTAPVGEIADAVDSASDASE